MDRYILAEETLSLAEWTSVLKLSAMWEMHRLHHVMVNRMSTLTATEEEWTAVFKLDMSVRQLGSLPIGYLPAVESSQKNYHKIAGVDKTPLARRFKVERWLRRDVRNE